MFLDGESSVDILRVYFNANNHVVINKIRIEDEAQDGELAPSCYTVEAVVIRQDELRQHAEKLMDMAGQFES